MEMGTGLDYFMALPIYSLIATVKDYTEVVDEINEQRKRMTKRK